MKENQDELFAGEDEPTKDDEKAELEEVPAGNNNKLNEDNLSKFDQKSVKSSKKSQKSKKSRPAWALTEKQQEEAKEEEIDELLEFAYDLDYDKYMEDFEIRQVFSIIKDRVNEIKKD
jgi:hypothetical protein